MKLSAAILAAFVSTSGKFGSKCYQKCDQKYLEKINDNFRGECLVFKWKTTLWGIMWCKWFRYKNQSGGYHKFFLLIIHDFIFCLLGPKKSVRWHGQPGDTWLKACRAEGFAGIDFPNSFVWGDSSVTKLVNPACGNSCTYADVVTPTGTGSETCSQVKPVIGLTDGDSAATHSWTVPFNECGVTGTFDDTTNQWKYDLYFNSNSGNFYFQSIFTMWNSTSDWILNLKFWVMSM